MNEENVNWLQLGLRALFEQRRHCDVTIIAEKHEFPCHKAVLAAASEYFDTMFSSSMTEAKSDVISIAEVREDVFNSVLQYIYGNCSVISTENVEYLLQAADRFQISLLKNNCEDFLLERLSVENCIGFWVTGLAYACPKLQATSWNFITENFDLVRKSEELLKLEKEDFLKVISSNEINTLSEEHVCEVAIEWIKHNEPSRKQYFVEVLQELRLCQVSLEFLLEKLFSIKYCHSSSEVCTKLLKDAIKYHALPEKRHMMDCLKIRPRNVSSLAEMTVVLGRRQSQYDEDATEVIGYNSLDDKWYSLCPLPVDIKEEFATCSYGDDIYVSGGTARPEVLFHFSSKHYRWQEKSKMNQGRYRHNMVPAKGSLIVLGGYNFGTISSVENYDIANNSWEHVGDLLYGVDAASAAIQGDRIFVFGGLRSFSKVTDTIQCFDTTTNTCSIFGTLPRPQCNIKTATFKHKTFLAFQNGEIYSFKPNSKLEFVHKMENFDRKDFGFLRDGSQCYFIGGSTNSESEEDGFDSSCHFTDAIDSMSADDGTIETLPSELPIPLVVYGCHNTVIRKKYPLVELKEVLEHL